jgi:toxin CcdB
MARFDVYANKAVGGYLLDVQADLLSGLNTRMVVPLLPLKAAPKPAAQLNPAFEINGTAVSMVTQFMAAIPEAELKRHVASLDQHRETILAAIDFLHQGW